MKRQRKAVRRYLLHQNMTKTTNQWRTTSFHHFQRRVSNTSTPTSSGTKQYTTGGLLDTITTKTDGKRTTNGFPDTSTTESDEKCATVGFIDTTTSNSDGRCTTGDLPDTNIAKPNGKHTTSGFQKTIDKQYGRGTIDVPSDTANNPEAGRNANDHPDAATRSDG
ncbi:unnamed protein product [Lactuca saligna]|uniref:Uncharacterized protein n=1 Tax=Lactuca saligna TaxID=75948 RepID=A0AA35URB0_LACSI|nr:unnamed protein product [Lactuca saligna]